MYILGISGSRCLTLREPVRDILESVHDTDLLPSVDALCTGVARGVDSIAREWAIDCRYLVIDCPVTREQWDTWKAERFSIGNPGHSRNNLIAHISDSLLAIRVRDKAETPGTLNCIKAFKRLGKQVIEIVVDDIECRYTTNEAGDLVQVESLRIHKRKVWPCKLSK